MTQAAPSVQRPSPSKPRSAEPRSSYAPAEHSPAFLRVRDRIVDLSEDDRARFARFFGALLDPKGPLGAPARDTLRAIAQLDDADLERLTRWFEQHVNRWGQFPRDAAHGSPGYAYSAGPKKG
jgi:hypothetical protein